MNKRIDQTELSKEVAQATGLPQSTADAFISHFFSEIENNLINGISSNVEGLGIFRIIKSGDSNKILFLGGKKNIKQDFTKNTLLDRLSNNSANTPRVKPIANKEIKEYSSSTKNRIDRNKTLFSKDDNTSRNEEDKISSKQENISNDTKGKDLPLDREGYTTKTILLQKDKADHLEPTQNLENNIGSNSTESELVINEQKKREEKKKSAIILPIFISLLILVIIIGVSYLFFENAKKNSLKPKEEEYAVNFHELTVNDSISFNYIVIPDKDVSLEYIAHKFYGNEIFWPYIYVANEDFMNNSTIALAGSIIKIPKLTVDLVAYNKGSVTTAAQTFGDEIRKSKKIY